MGKQTCHFFMRGWTFCGQAQQRNGPHIDAVRPWRASEAGVPNDDWEICTECKFLWAEHKALAAGVVDLCHCVFCEGQREIDVATG